MFRHRLFPEVLAAGRTDHQIATGQYGRQRPRPALHFSCVVAFSPENFFLSLCAFAGCVTFYVVCAFAFRMRVCTFMRIYMHDLYARLTCACVRCCLFPGVLAAGRTNDRVATGRVLQHGRQRPRPALRLLGGDGRIPGLHQEPGK